MSKRPCNKKDCKHCKKGTCRNRRFKVDEDWVQCNKRVLCICRVEESPVIKTEVEVNSGSMTLEHCADCGIEIRSYPTEPLGTRFERVKTLVENMLKKTIEDIKIAENNNDHAKALKLNGAGSVLAELSSMIELIEEVDCE